MEPIQIKININSLSLLAGTVVISGALLLSSWQGTWNTKQWNLTAEQVEILSHMSMTTIDDGYGNPLETIEIHGCNVRIVNGLGNTYTANGLGNLIVGYNELGNVNGDDRTGSHNYVGGRENSYSRWAGAVFGRDNTISYNLATVLGGHENTAGSGGSVVVGGKGNLAAAEDAVVGGGYMNTASGVWSVVSGGHTNTASVQAATVAGGHDNEANGPQSTVSGGTANVTTGTFASVTGGRGNEAAGDSSTIAGGLFALESRHNYTATTELEVNGTASVDVLAIGQ